MNHREFQRIINTLADEIGGDGEMIALHNLSGEVFIYDIEGNEYEIVDIRPHQMIGCGCYDAIIIEIRRLPDK